MAEEQHRNGAAPREIQDIRGEHTARWREIDREMQETARRLQQTYELFVSEWDKLIEALAKRDLIPLLNSRGIEVDHVSRHLAARRRADATVCRASLLRGGRLPAS